MAEYLLLVIGIIAIITVLVRMVWHYVLYIGYFKKSIRYRDVKKILKAEKVILSGGDKMAFQVMSYLAQQNVPHAMYYLGVLHYYGMGVEKDSSEAYSLMQKAAVLGYKNAGKVFNEGFDSAMYVPGYTKNMVNQHCPDYDLEHY